LEVRRSDATSLTCALDITKREIVNECGLAISVHMPPDMSEFVQQTEPEVV
jgi:hypothetical protein